MPRKELVVRVFVAAPDDVRDEVTALTELVDELNRAHSLHSGVRLELLNWRTDVIPGLGIDPQAIINDQIGDDYDIFVGILWTKFGTPTPRAGSGIEEEFERAHRRHESDPTSVRVMLYFKTASVAPDDIDPKQLTAVREFRSRVRDQAVYCKFADREEFVNFARLHLTRHIQFWSSTHPVTDVSHETSVGVPAPLPSEEAEGEEGFLDLMEIGVRSLAEATEAVQQMAALQAENSVRTQLNTKQLEAVAHAPPDQRNPLVKQVFDIVATDLNALAKGLNDESARFSAAFATSMEAMSKALGYQEFWPRITPDQRSQYADALAQLETTSPALELQMAALHETIAGLPRMTTIFNRAKKNAMAAIDKVRKSLATATRLAVDLRKSGFFKT